MTALPIPADLRTSDPSKARRRRDLVAAAASGLIHIALFILIFGAAHGELVSAESGPSGGDPPMTVTLVSPKVLSPRPQEAGGALVPLFAELDAVPAPPVVVSPDHPSNDFTRLADRLAAAAPKPPPPPSPPRERPPPTPEPPEPAPAKAKLADAGKGQAKDTASGTAGTSGSTGGLWGRIEPCWRDLGSGSTVPVTLEVALDPDGRISIPPKILRGPIAADEARLRAESRALAALSACLPRSGAGFGGRVYTLEFKASR